MYNTLNRIINNGTKDTERLKKGNKITVRCESCNAKIEVEAPEKGKSQIFGCEYCGSTNVISAIRETDLATYINNKLK